MTAAAVDDVAAAADDGDDVADDDGVEMLWRRREGEMGLVGMWGTDQTLAERWFVVAGSAPHWKMVISTLLLREQHWMLPE